MGRGMRPLSPDSGPVERFACELRALRALAGDLPFWKMARRCSVAKSALAAAAAGRQLPSEKVTREFVRACGGDWGYWEQRWARAKAEAEQIAHAPGKAVAERRPGLVDVLSSRLPARFAEPHEWRSGTGSTFDVYVPRRGRPRWRSVSALALAGVLAGVGLSWTAGLLHHTDTPTRAVSPPTDGTDPQLAGCGGDAERLAVAAVRLRGPLVLRGRRLPGGTRVGKVTLRYSAHCAGAWARFDPDPVIDTDLQDSTAGSTTVWARRPADTTQETWRMGHVDEAYSGLLLTGLGCVVAGARFEVTNENMAAEGQTPCLPVLSVDRRSASPTAGP
ncbi:DUF2690 domain-containing protein [Streptacidiphilus griseoplanus]|uniref:DUF2690 domain-containing protein n=1 Tax=Peterkaempfera griseoplana TaxID=66896 RepID=UPI000B2AE3E5|nr:DUF2690 domain-containing protein [Peterkaempfera griseoplana]